MGSVELVVEGKRSRNRMGFRDGLVLAFALLSLTGAMGKKTFEQFEGFKINDPNSIIDSYPEVDQETCEKLCNLQSLCKGYQVDTLDETCELLADTEEPQVDEFFHLFKLE